MPKRESFKIAHFSDLHLTKKDSASRSEPNLFGALKGMNAAFRKIVKTPAVQKCDLVLVTGDVTDRGDLEAWKVFWDALRAAGTYRKALVLPGNHDVCCLGVRLPPLKRKGYRDKDLEKAAKGLQMGGQKAKFPWVAIPDPRVAIFALNSNNLGNWSVATNALGELGYYQLASLASKLSKHRDVPVKIVALHHSPNIPEVATAKRRGQRPIHRLERGLVQIQAEQRRALRLLCITQRVRLIVHGHLHMHEDRRVTGIRIMDTPATTQPLSRKGPEKYRFYTYTVYGDGGRVVPKITTVTV